MLSAKSGFPAHTLHSEIYHFKDIMGDVDPSKEQTAVNDCGEMRLIFEIQMPDQESQKVYIVDEASMIRDERTDHSSFASFGSGHLLNDFMRLVGNNKVIFSGHPSQLPPVGYEESPALSEKFFRKLGKKVFSFEMTQSSRKNRILKRSSSLPMSEE